MFKYSKLVLTGIAGIGGGITLDRCFLNHFKDVYQTEKHTGNKLEKAENATSSSTFKVFIFYIIEVFV